MGISCVRVGDAVTVRCGGGRDNPRHPGDHLAIHLLDVLSVIGRCSVKLTLRDLFWLVLVVALGCGWWLDRQRLDLREEQLLQLSSELADSERETEKLRGFFRRFDPTDPARVEKAIEALTGRNPGSN